MPINHEVIERNGWRQGSIFTLPASRPLIAQHRESIAVHGFVIPDDSRLLLTSHDCDIVHPGPHEPRIEVCPAVPLAGRIDGNFTGTRNPRRLQLELEVDGALRPFELRAPTRFLLPREVLEASAADANARISAGHNEFFRHWLAKRFRRTALPTTFDGRIDRNSRNRIRDALRATGNAIESILIAIDPEDLELPPEEDYTTQIVALMTAANFGNPELRNLAEIARTQVQETMDACPGVDLDVCLCVSSAEMTVDEFRDFSIWDYDDLSHEANAQPPQALP